MLPLHGEVLPLQVLLVHFKNTPVCYFRGKWYVNEELAMNVFIRTREHVMFSISYKAKGRDIVIEWHENVNNLRISTFYENKVFSWFLDRLKYPYYGELEIFDR